MLEPRCDLFVFAGEASGDLHGEKLLAALLKKRPDLSVFGVGGPKMRALGMRTFLPMEEFQVMGFIDVLFALPKLMRQFYQVRRAILKSQPKAVLFIDYPGFNLRMAASLRKKNYKGKLCHYICPSVWAWGKKRIPLMEKTLDLLLTFFPFEVNCFSSLTLKVAFVGHPLVKRITEQPFEPLLLPPHKTLIGIFPGSRRKEIERNFPLHLRTAKRVLSHFPQAIVAVSISQEEYLPLLKEKIQEEGMSEHISLVPPENTYALMQACTLAIAKSGTVTLELALHQVPSIVTYAVTALDFFIAWNLLRIRLPYYCIANIAYGKEVFPELIGPNFTEENLYKHTAELLSCSEKRLECQKKCKELRQLLQDKDASEEASSEILKRLYQIS